MSKTTKAKSTKVFVNPFKNAKPIEGSKVFLEKHKSFSLAKDWIIQCLDSLDPKKYQIFNRKYWVWKLDHATSRESLLSRTKELIETLDTTLYHSATLGENNPAITSYDAGIDWTLIDWDRLTDWLAEKLQETTDRPEKTTVYTEFDLWGNPVRSTLVVDRGQQRQTLTFAGNQTVCQQLGLGL